MKNAIQSMKQVVGITQEVVMGDNPLKELVFLPNGDVTKFDLELEGNVEPLTDEKAAREGGYIVGHSWRLR